MNKNTLSLIFVSAIGFVLLAALLYVGMRPTNVPVWEPEVSQNRFTAESEQDTAKQAVNLFPEGKVILRAQFVRLVDAAWELKMVRGTSPEDTQEVVVRVELEPGATITTLKKTGYGFEVIPATAAEFKANDPLELEGKWLESDTVFAADKIHNLALTYNL